MPRNYCKTKNKKSSGIYVIPTAIMDTMLIREKTTIEKATKKCINLIKEVKKKSGVVVLDWHDAMWNTTFFDPVMIETYINILNYLEKDKDAWVTTPSELIKWWDSRLKN